MATNDNNINIPIQIREEIDSYMRKFIAGDATLDDLDPIIALLEGESQDVKNNTLHYAVKDGSPELINAIIGSGAGVNSIIEGNTPMMAAIIDININAPDYLWERIEQQKNIIEALLDNGANPSEIVGGKSMADVIDDTKKNILEGHGNRNIEIDFRRLIQRLEDIKAMINERREMIDGGKRKRKRTQKKRKKSKKGKKSKKYKKRKSKRTRKHSK